MSQQSSRTSRRILLATAMMGGSLLTATDAFGVVISAGQSNVAPDIYPAPAFAALAPGLIAEENLPFVGTDALGAVHFLGFLDSRVYIDPGSGTLDFAYQLTSDVTSPDAIHKISVTSYIGSITDVYDVLGTGAFAYDSASRSSAPLGRTVSLDYTNTPNSIQPGATNDWILIKTDATTFTNGSAAIIDGGNAQVASFAPLPEPSSICILVVGAGVFIGRRAPRQNRD